MLRAMLEAVAYLQIGARVRKLLERLLWQSAIVAIAALLLFGAFVLAIIASSQFLLALGFASIDATAILCIALLILGLLVLSILPLSRSRQVAQAGRNRVASPEKSLALMQDRATAAAEKIGPLPLVAVAFVAGLMMSRR